VIDALSRVARLLLISWLKTRGEERDMDFNEDKAVRHRMDEIKKRLAAQRRERKTTGSVRRWKQESES
jgi:hypothetical protein